MQLRTTIDGSDQHVVLEGEAVRLGRGIDNDVVLSDFSVSRSHAVVERRGMSWWVRDLKSTNGVRLNGEVISEAQIRPGDHLTVGCFELMVENDQVESSRRAPLQARRDRRHRDDELANAKTRSTVEVEPGLTGVANATIVRRLADFTAEYGLDGTIVEAPLEAVPEDPEHARRIVRFLTRLAGSLLSAESVDEVLERVMAVAFDALGVDRGFILLQDEEGEVSCQLARFGDDVQMRPTEEVPVSRTILDTVMSERVALLTFDAMTDQRWTGGESIRLHQIRAAMSVPLWSGEKIIGVMQVDSPVRVGTFDQGDLDFLTAVANYAAVAVEGLRYARRAEVERRRRGQLERYHSPAVIEEVLRRGDLVADDEGAEPRLRSAQVTVLFADLVGFTALAEELEPEAVASLLEQFFTAAAEAIFAAGGTLDKFIGDCVMAFFGAPMEQPDHALRGVRAAQQIVEAVERWNQRPDRGDLPLLALRVAVNSGPVVVGDIGSNRRVDYTVLGNTVNVAARLEEQAAAGGDIIIGPETHRLLAGSVPTEALGEIRLRGLSQTVCPHRVLRT